jgi:hypothetical protein
MPETTNAYELYRALQDCGVESRLILCLRISRHLPSGRLTGSYADPAPRTALRSFNHGIFSPAFFPLGIIPLFNLVCYRREEKPREKVLRKNRLLAECYCAKLKVSRNKLIINELLVEAAGVEPASENVTGQENYMLSRVHAPGITLGRSRSALRTDKKRVPLACGLSLPSQT